MRALCFEEFGGPEVLRVRELDEPSPSAWEVKIRVRATALNRADLLQLRGLYPAPKGAPSNVPGLEYSGVVHQVGMHVTRFKEGDRVMGLVGGGAFAEWVAVHEREVVRMPVGCSFEDAAAIPEAFVTAYDALVVQGGLRAGEVALVHAAGSGVGTAAVQLVHAVGATAIATARSPNKRERLEHELGPVHVISPGDSKRPSFAKEVRDLTAGRGADVALELVGGDYLPETVEAMASRGRIVLVGLLAGASAVLNLRTLLTMRLQLTGTVLRSRPAEEKMAAALMLERQLVPLFERGALKPVVDSTHPISDATKAFVRLSENLSYGKIVLRW